MRSAAKVGILVVVFVGMLFGAYAMLGRSLFANPGDRYFATLSDASGIAVGTRVLVAGVKVGSVTAVELVSPRQARLTLELNKGVRLANGSRLEVPSSLIGIGDVALQIVAPAQGTTGWLAVGSTLPGGKANAIDAFLPEGRDTIKELNKTLIAFRELLHDTKLRNGVNELLASSNKTIAPIDDPYQMFGKLYGQMKDQETLKSVLDDLKDDLARVKSQLGPKDHPLRQDRRLQSRRCVRRERCDSSFLR